MLTNDGGPAFPRAPFDVNDYTGDGAEGMTLRDYFAAKAMEGELSCQSEHKEWNNIDHLAEYSYQIADAMLKARNK